MGIVIKNTSDIQLEFGADIVNIRVANVGFASASANAMVNRPRVGAVQSTQGHVTAESVSIQFDVNRADYDSVRGMVGQSVIVRFVNGGEVRGLLMNLTASGEPATWQAEEPYVSATLNINATSVKVGRI